MIRLLIGTAALVLPAACFAQEAQSAAPEVCDGGPCRELVLIEPIDPRWIVVNGGLLRHDDGDEVQSSAMLRDLDPGLGARIENRLRDEAGIVQFRRSDGRTAHPTSQGVTLRGLGGNASSRALVTLDGVPQADPFGGWVAWSAYDAINLGGIIITRGGGSGVDGPGALAGWVQAWASATGVICHEMPHLSRHQPHSTSWPPWPTMAFQ